MPTTKESKTMKKFIIITSFVIAWGLSASTVSADTHVAASYGNIDTGITEHQGVILSVGSQFNSFIGVEGYALVSSTDDNYGWANVELDSLYGINLIGYLPITDSLSPYITFGHSKASATVSYSGYSESVSESGTSIGIGIKYQIVEAFSVNAQYTEYQEDLTGFTVGLTAHF